MPHDIMTTTATKISYRDEFITLHQGDVLDVLRSLPSESVHCVVTSPPYFGLRNYGIDGQIGLEETPAEFLSKMVAVFSEVRRLLRKDGTCWVNLGDSYNANQGAGFNAHAKTRPHLSGAGVSQKRIPEASRSTRVTGTSAWKPKDLMGIPWRVAFALQEAGWWLRQDIIWSKPNPMPESVTDRCTKAHEYVFLLTKSARYFYDSFAIRQPLAEASVSRLSQEVAALGGSDRVPGKTNGPMKAVRFGGTKYGDNEDAAFSPKSGAEWNPSTVGANKRSVWTIATQPFSEAHFATFPYELPETCIKAGTSEHGCCTVCGKPYVRIVEKGFTAHDGETDPRRSWNGSRFDTGKTYVHQNERCQKDRDRSFDWSRNGKEDSGSTLDAEIPQTTTIGWQKACKCETDEIVPCTVLEPFAGSGTSLIVAKKLGRRSIGIELNPEYAEMAARRIERETAMPLFDEASGLDGFNDPELAAEVMGVSPISNPETSPPNETAAASGTEAGKGS